MDLFLDLVEVLRHETKPAVIAVCRSPGSEPTIVTLTLRCWDGPGRNFHFADCRSGGSVAVRERDGSRTLWPSSLGSQLKQPGNIKFKEREISLPQLPTNQGDTPLHVIISAQHYIKLKFLSCRPPCPGSGQTALRGGARCRDRGPGLCRCCPRPAPPLSRGQSAIGCRELLIGR